MSILNSNNFLYKTVDGVKQFFSPLVNASTVVLEDGSRLEKDGKIHADTADDSKKLDGKDSVYFLQPRNLLDNSDFRNPINQRGQTSYDGSWLYGIDRWIVETDNPQSLGNIIWVDDGYVNMFYYHELIQQIPLKTLKGKTFTFVACGATGMTLMNVIVPQNYGSGIEYYGSNWENGKYILEAIKFENRDTVSFRLRSNYNGWQALYWAALYEGSYTADNLPPYVPKGYAAELAECQKYFRRVSALDSVYETVFNGNVTDGAATCVIALFYGTMRTTPTISVKEDGGIIVRGVGGYSNDATYSAPYKNAQFVAYGNKGIVAVQKNNGGVWANLTNNAPITITLKPLFVLDVSADL